MTLNEYINELKTFIKTNPGSGELETYAYSDDEGNSLNKVNFGPCIRFIDSTGEQYALEDLGEIEASNIKRVVVIN